MTIKLITTLIAFVFIISNNFGQCQSEDPQQNGSIRNEHREPKLDLVGLITGTDDRPESVYEQRGLWIAGFDPAGNIHMAIASGGSDVNYIPGPIIKNADADLLDDYCQYYNRIWTVSKSEIEAVKLMFISGTLSIDFIPKDILEWPAKSNPHLGRFSVDYDMAPFVDSNGDSNYNPLDGDYPIALADKPDFSAFQFNFTVYNGGGEDFSSADPISIELHQTNYMSNCQESTELDHSVFTHIKFINKGDITYSGFKLAVWEDIDLGVSTKSYIGCSPELNSTFIYSEPRIYENKPFPNSNYAIRSTVFFNKDIEGFMGYANGGIGAEPPQTTDPSDVNEIYNYLQNKWRDGTPLTEGGNGFNPSNSAIETNFIYPGMPNNPSSWSMLSEDNSFKDMRSLTQIYSGELTPGHEGVIDFVDHIKYSSTYNSEAMFEMYEDYINILKAEYSELINDTIVCDENECTSDCLWPGDVNSNGIVDGYDLILNGVAVAQELNSGPRRDRESIWWHPFSSQDWDEEVCGINAKNFDIDGGGLIDSSDFVYNVCNLGYELPDYQEEKIETLDSSVLNLKVSFNEDSVDYATGNFFDRIILFTTTLGDIDEPLAESIHGLSYEMRVDSHYFSIFGNESAVDPEGLFQYKSQFEYSERDELGFIIIDQDLPLTLSNFNGRDQVDGFPIIRTDYILRDNLTTNNPDGRDTLNVRFFNIKAINAAGEKIDVGVISDELILYNLTFDPDLILSDAYIIQEVNSLSIYPNPVGDHLYVTLEEVDSGSITIYNIQGQLLLQEKIINDNQLRIEIFGLSAGMHILRYMNQDGVGQTYKFIKL